MRADRHGLKKRGERGEGGCTGWRGWRKANRKIKKEGLFAFSE